MDLERDPGFTNSRKFADYFSTPRHPEGQNNRHEPKFIFSSAVGGDAGKEHNDGMLSKGGVRTSVLTVTFGRTAFNPATTINRRPLSLHFDLELPTTRYH